MDDSSSAIASSCPRCFFFFFSFLISLLSDRSSVDLLVSARSVETAICSESACLLFLLFFIFFPLSVPLCTSLFFFFPFFFFLTASTSEISSTGTIWLGLSLKESSATISGTCFFRFFFLVCSISATFSISADLFLSSVWRGEFVEFVSECFRFFFLLRCSKSDMSDIVMDDSSSCPRCFLFFFSFLISLLSDRSSVDLLVSARSVETAICSESACLLFFLFFPLSVP